MAKETLTVEIRAQADKAIQEMRRYNDTMKKSAERVGRLTKMVKAYWAEALIAIAAIKKMAQFVKSLTDAYIADERAEALLNSTLKATGIWTESLSKQLTRYGVEMQKVTVYSKAQVWEAQGIVATFTQIGTDIYPRVIESAMNMSQVFGQDLKQSIIQLSKAINDPRMVENLSRIGVTMSDAQIKMIDYNVEIGNVAEAQRIILEELELEMGNVARAIGKTFGGQVEIAKNLVVEWKGAIGELLAEQAQPMIEWLVAFLQNMENLDKVKKIVKTFFGIFAAGMATNIATIKTFVWSLDMSMAALVAAAIIMKSALSPKTWGSGEMKAALKDLRDYTKELTQDMTDSWREAGEKTKWIFDDLFKDEITNIDTVSWIYENAMQRVREAIENTGGATKKAKEYTIEWRDQMAVAGLDASFFVSQQRDLANGIGEVTEAMKEGDEVIMTYTEHIGLLSEQVHDLTDLKGELEEAEKKLAATQLEMFNMIAPAYSAFFIGLGDQTIAFKDQLKDVFSSLLRMLGEEMLARAVAAMVPLPGVFNPVGAAPAFAAAAGAFVAAGLIKSLATGGQFVTTGPEIVQVGERGAERVTVEPIADVNNSVTMPLTIQFGHQTIRRELQYQLDNEGIVIHRRIVV